MTIDLKRKFVVGFGLAILVFIGLLLYGDIQGIGRLLQDFRWRLIPAILGLTVFNYLVRGLRFHYYLHQIGVTNINLWTSLRVFIGGFSLTLTPGKVGEFIRLLWLKNLTGAGPARTAPSIIVDRMLDGLALAILAAVGALAYPQFWPAVALTLAILMASIIVVQIRPLALWVLNFGEKLPGMKKFIHQLYILYESTYELLRFKNFFVGLGVGLVAWSTQGVAFYLILVGLGEGESINLLLSTIFALSVGLLVGGVSSLPGGLGATEISLTGILQTVVHLPEAVAATATLMIRFFTLWFGVISGILTVVIWHKMLFGKNVDESGLNIERRPELVDPKPTYEQMS